MKHILSLFFLISLGAPGFAQYIYTIRADSVKLTNCDSSELIIENHTRGVSGFLFNTGNGRTVFKRGVVKINDSLYVIGMDTLNLKANAWVQGGNSFGTTGVLGTRDNNPLIFSTNNLERIRVFNSGNVSINNGTDAGFRLDVNGTTNLRGRLTAQQGAFFYSALSFNGDASQNIIYANTLTLNTNNVLGNSTDGIYNFTSQIPAANSGGGHSRLIHINKLVNRGSQDGEETAMRIDFSVTGSAGDLRAIHAVTGNVIVETGNFLIGSTTGSTSRLDITGSNGFSQLRLRTQYTPTSSSDSNGNTGDIAVDDNYFYYKTSTGWKRSALSTF